MNTDFIKGVVVPMITPIDKDELIDEAAIRSQVDYVIDGGVSGILLFGSNQHQKVRSSCKDGSSKRRSKRICSAADVLKAN